MVQCCDDSIRSLCGLLRTVTSIHHTTWNAIFSVTSKTKQRQSGRSDGTLTVFLVRRRNLHSWSSRFCSQRHWLTPMFSLFSIHYITNYITLYLLFVSVSCIVFRLRSARNEVSIVLPRVLPCDFWQFHIPLQSSFLIPVQSVSHHYSIVNWLSVMMLQQFPFDALDWPIVSKYLNFAVNIAVSGLCNSTYFCPFVLTVYIATWVSDFCQQPLCLF